MKKLFLIGSLFFVISSNPLAWGTSERKTKSLSQKLMTTRRSFLRGLFAVGAATAIPGSTSALTNSLVKSPTIHTDVLRYIAKIRLKTIMTSREGLKTYITELKKLHSRLKTDYIQSLVERRIDLAENTLQNIRLMKVRQKKISRPSKVKTNLEDSQSQTDQISKIRQRITSDFSNMPIDLQVMTIRSLIDPLLLRKMAWQSALLNTSEGHFPKVLSLQEVQFLKEFANLLEDFREPARKSPLSQQILEQSIAEVSSALSAYEYLQRRGSGQLYCRQIF